MVKRNILVAGLTVGAFAAAGCGQTIGNTISAGEGECVTMDGTIDLAPEQRVFVGNGTHYQGDFNDGYPDRAISRRLQIRNIGSGVLELNSDDGTLKYGDALQQSGNITLELQAPNLAQAPNDFTYEQNNSSTTFQFHRTNAASQHVTLAFATDCK